MGGNIMPPGANERICADRMLDETDDERRNQWSCYDGCEPSPHVAGNSSDEGHEVILEEFVDGAGNGSKIGYEHLHGSKNDANQNILFADYPDSPNNRDKRIFLTLDG